MTTLQSWLDRVSGLIWSEFVLIPLLTLTGIYLTIGLKAMPWRHLLDALRLLIKGRTADPKTDGDISPFQALMTALSATIGTGNIAGVATAIYYGGPGAIFWMWCIALFGMATKYAEAVLAVRYREFDALGNAVGGPMYYIKNGLGARFAWLGGAFALFGMCAAFGIGNMVQANTVARELAAAFVIPTWLTGLLIALLAGITILGGVKRIAEVAAKLVPFMTVAYLLGTLIIIVSYYAEVPAAIRLIITAAFTDTAAEGGFLGATVLIAIRFGVARGIFSNEAGLGSAAIAHAAAKTNNPVAQGMVAMLGTFIDTLVICTMTALVIILTGAWTSGIEGSEMTRLAFNTGFSGGGLIVTFGVAIFAFTTILGWSYYGERCAEYLFGIKAILPYRIAWIIAIVIGALAKISLVWTIADILNGLMALPNLIALILLSPITFAITREYFAGNTHS